MKTTGILAIGAVLCLGNVLGAARPDLVAQVKSGKLTEARASWWGFDPADSTAILQAAIDSRVPRLIIDRTDTPWIVLPLRGVSDQELFFEPGAVVQAKRGEYRPKNACLLTFRNCANVRLVGPGATLRMWHADYMKPPYEKSEWRHALSILSCRNVLIDGLTLASSGGDGLYLGSAGGKLCRSVDVVVRNVTCRDNHRQGISVITAENLLIENTVMRDTHGTPPAAGIDFEPNRPNEALTNCVMRNCRTFNNEGCGYTTWAGQLNASSTPLDIRFENCTSLGDRTAFAFSCSSRRGRDVGGLVTIKGCRFEKSRTFPTVNLKGNRMGTLTYDIEDNVIVETNAAGTVTTTVMDAAWRNAHFPDKYDPDFALPSVTDPDFSRARIHDAAPGKSVRLQPIRIRSWGTYLVHADSARTLRFTGHQCRVGRYAPAKSPIRVTTQDGKPVATIPLPGLDDAPFSFAAPAAGFYRLNLELDSVAFTLTSADAPVAIDVTDLSQGLISSAGLMWFDVPPGTSRMAVFTSGQGVERVRVALADPSGKRVWDCDNVSDWRKYAESDPAAGLWRLTLAKPSSGCFEDSLHSLAGIPAFLFLSDQKTWRLVPSAESGD